MDKTICKVADVEEQQAETYRYWQSRSIGERLKAVCEVTESAYSFAAAFRKVSDEPDQEPEGHQQ